jgi:hypothetical protein
MWVNWSEKLLVVQEVLSLRFQKFCIFHNLFNNIRMSLCDSKDIA